MENETVELTLEGGEDRVGADIELAEMALKSTAHACTLNADGTYHMTFPTKAAYDAFIAAISESFAPEEVKAVVLARHRAAQH